MKKISIFVLLLLIFPLFCISCDKDEPVDKGPTYELIEQLFENKDVEYYLLHPAYVSSSESMIRAAIEAYGELRETYPELIELEGKEDAVEKLLDFSEECLRTKGQYGKGGSALIILDREVFRNQMSPSERERFEKICTESIRELYWGMEWYKEKAPE